jgi:hypothetical protein
LTQTSHNRDLAKETQAAHSRKPKIEVSLEDQKAIDKLNAKFRQASIRERQQDRGI